MEREKEQKIPRNQIPEGPGYTPQARVRLPEELVDQARRRTPASQAPTSGTFLNTKTGQVHIVESNPPRGSDWIFLFPETSLSLEDIRQIVSRASLEDILPTPQNLHF